MAKRKSKNKRFGLSGIMIPIIGAMFTVGFTLSLAIPVFFLRVHLNRVLEIQYGYDNAGTALLALLSDKAMYRNISLYVAGTEDNTGVGFSRAGVEEGIRYRLDRLVGSCYALSYGDGNIVEGGDCEATYSANAYVVLPDGSEKEEVTLWIQSEFEGKMTPEFEFEVETYCCINPVSAEAKCLTKETCFSTGWDIIDETAQCDDPLLDCHY